MNDSAPCSQTALVTGASGGIGLAIAARLLERPDMARVYAATRNLEQAKTLTDLATADPRLEILVMDLTDPQKLEAAVHRMQQMGQLDLVINTAGILHDDNGMRPERRLTDVSAENLMQAFNTNAIGALMLAQAVEPLLRAAPHPIFTSLSARVASVSDNRLGGWYAYRASKAALNMMIKTLAIEWARFSPAITCVALHPGTVKTDLSRPFLSRTSENRIFSPTQAADYLLAVIQTLTPEQTGQFLAYDGRQIPW